MQYMLLLHFEEAGWFRLTSDEQRHWLGASDAYRQALISSGVLLHSSSLPAVSDAACVRIENGKTQVLDGPYADSKEQLGGYYAIDVVDLDAAIAWAARCPGALYGTIEIRALGRKFNFDENEGKEVKS